MPTSNYADLYQQAGNQYGIDPLLLQVQGDLESRGDPTATGPATPYGRAHGIAQLIPATAKSLGVTDPNDPKQAILAQARLMAENIKRYGDTKTALLAYHGGTNQDNWGPKTKAYAENIVNNYHQAASKTMDPIEQALSAETASPGSTEMAGDPIEQALSAKDVVSEQGSKSTEPDYSGVHGIAQDIGRSVTGPKIRSGLAELGSNWPASMSPTDIAMLAPATMASGVAGEGVGALGNLLTRASPELAQAVAGSKMLQLAGAGAVGAAQGGVFNAATGQNPNTGAAGGALVNMLVPGVNAVGSTLAPEVATLAKNAATKYGVKIPGGLLSDNPVVNRVYSGLSRFGLTPKNDNMANFTKAISKTFGEDTPKLTRAAMDKAEDNISNMFDDVRSSVPSIDLNPTGQGHILNRLANTHQYSTDTDPSGLVAKQIDRIMNIAAKNNGALPSESYALFTDSNSALSGLAKQSGAVGDAAREAKNALYDALGVAAPANKLDQFNTARKYYKNFKTVQNVAAKDPVTGELNPLSISAQVNKTTRRFGDAGLEDLQELGDIGRTFALTPSSGTAENLLLAKGLGVLGTGAASGFATGTVPGAVAGLGAAYAGGKLAGKALSSDTYRNWLINKSLSTNSGMLPSLVNSPGMSLIENNYVPAAFIGNKLLGQPNQP